MCNDDHGHAAFAAAVLQELEDGLAGLVIQRARRLVAEQELWVFGKRPRDRDALLLPTGQLRREIALPLLEPDLLQHRGGDERVGAELGRDLHVFKGCEVRDQIVKLENKADLRTPVGGQTLLVIGGDLLPVDKDASLGEGIHAAEDIQKRGFSRAGLAHDHADLAPADLKAHIVQGGDLHLAGAVYLFDVFKTDKRVFHRNHPPSVRITVRRWAVNPRPRPAARRP